MSYDILGLMKSMLIDYYNDRHFNSSDVHNEIDRFYVECVESDFTNERFKKVHSEIENYIIDTELTDEDEVYDLIFRLLFIEREC